MIIEDGKALLLHRITKEKEYWVFPGGGVEEYDESLEAALIRECEEELGVKVDIGDFFMNAYFEMNGEDQEQHIFFCEIISGELGSGQGPEYQPAGGYEGSFEVEWVAFADLKHKHVLPEEVKDKIIEDLL